MMAGQDQQADRRPGFAAAMALVFLPFAAGYFFSYLFRSVNAVVAPHLVAAVGAAPAELGLLSAAYLATFAAMQIPVGVMLDRFGPRRLLAALYMIAAVGGLLFSQAESVAGLTIGRALIGLGMAGGLMGALKAVVLWFPAHRVPLLNGWILAVGGFGALVATVPVELALRVMDWRALFAVLAGGVALAAVLILVVVPERPEATARGSLPQLVRELSAIYRDPFFWRLGPLIFTCSASNMAFQGLWAGPWLAEVVGLDGAGVAALLLLLAVGMMVGQLLNGPVIGGFRRLGVPVAAVPAIGGAVYVAVQLLILLRLAEGATVWLGLGLAATLMSAVFSAFAAHYPPTQIGRANTALNVLTLGMAFAYQAVLGLIVNLWPALPDGSYPAVAYQVAFGVSIATQLAAVVWFVAMPRRQ